MAGRGGLSTSTTPPVAARRTPGGPQRCTGAGWSAGRVLGRRATSAHTGVETGSRYPREGDRRVFGSCGPPSARPRAARESSPSPRAPGAGWSGSVPPAVPVLRPTAGFQTGRARAQCAPGAYVIWAGIRAPGLARCGAGPRRDLVRGAGSIWLTPETRPCPGVAVVRRSLVPRRTAPPKGSLPRGKAARRVRSNNHTTTTAPAHSECARTRPVPTKKTRVCDSRRASFPWSVT